MLQNGDPGTRMTRQETRSTRGSTDLILTEGGVVEAHDTKQMSNGGGRNVKILRSVNDVGIVHMRRVST